MPASPDLLDRAPAWVLRPLAVGAVVDEKLEERIDRLAEKLAENLSQISQALTRVRMYREYDSAANRAGAHVWLAREELFAAEDPHDRELLARFAVQHMTEAARARILRRLAKDRHVKVRRLVREAIQRGEVREVALPQKRDGDWSPEGWLHGIGGQLQRRATQSESQGLVGRMLSAAGLRRHEAGTRVQEKRGLPPIKNVGQLRELLGIRSAKQLGYFLLATESDDGPYTTFTIPKRDGSPREISAPKAQLRWVQRRILRKILDLVSPHDAAHGFTPGRSTVTNAQPHVGAELVLKFDLTDFFPTIHYYRVMGLFSSLGYSVDDARFGVRDGSRQVAPVLARLCTYTRDPQAWGEGVLPQGAPTSPAISNLVCRGLDARLHGLAQRCNGVYTRYADDLTFSFKHRQLEVGRFRWWVDQICHQEGFIVNQSKFRVIRRSQRQTVTGVVVNDALRVPRRERRRFRAILHNCRLHGVKSQARGNPAFESYLRGFASYIHMVYPEEGQELFRQLDELLGAE